MGPHEGALPIGTERREGRGGVSTRSRKSRARRGGGQRGTGTFGGPAITIKDVARTAGVSLATVSRVLNGSASVSDAAQRSVREAAAALAYRPNRLARSLVTHQTHTLGVLLPDLYGEFFSEVIRGVDVTARENGYHLLVSSSHANTEELLSVVHAMHGRIDGLIVMAPDVGAPDALRRIVGCPAVLLDGGSGAGAFDSISLANYQGARLGVEHLLGLGHRRIATVTGPLGNLDAQQRLLGYRDALRDVGLSPDPRLEFEGAFTESSGFDAGDALLDLSPPPTAVFCANDYMAVGLMGRLQEAGIRVPEALSVVGFDDIAMARYLTPALTTVHVDTHELGARAVRLLLELLADGRRRPGEAEILQGSLVVRASSGPPPDRPIFTPGGGSS